MEHITQDQAQVTEMDEGRMDTKEWQIGATACALQD